MVFFNWATMQMAAKIVYYGPGLCGKTTNLSHIYAKTAPGSRGEMVSLETESDRTLFFDLLPLEVGKVGGFRTRLQLYTVPGQVFYNTTRKLVLKGVDGVVFVADSQRPMAQANTESLQNLADNLRELGLDLDSIPLVFQYNKRDLKNILSVDELNDALNGEGNRSFFEAIAVDGAGVFETLKSITKLTLRSLRHRMSGQESTSKAARAVVAAPTTRTGPAFSPSKLSAAAEEGLTTEAPEAVPAEETVVRNEAAAGEPVTEERYADEAAEAVEELPLAEEAEAAEDGAAAGTGTVHIDEPEVEAALDAAMPTAEEAEELPVAAEAPDGDDEAAVEFDTSAADGLEPAAPEMRHVKVSSSMDILAELESLRKAATTRPAHRGGGAPVASLDIDSILQSSLNSRQEVKRRVEEEVGDAFLRARRCVVRLELTDAEGATVTEVEPVDVELKKGEALRHFALTLTVHLKGQ